MVLNRTTSLDHCRTPLALTELPVPAPGPGELLVRVVACGVCHTELDEIEGRTPPRRLPAVLGHEVIGIVERLGTGAQAFAVGDRVGVGWIYRSSGRKDENLSPEFQATGRDASGGYAEYMTIPEQYAYPIPSVFSDVEAAPLLCAGAIGYRALRLTNLQDGAPLGLMGFGGSAHLVLQLAQHRYPNSEIVVFARDAEVRHFACQLGAAWAGDIDDRSPQPLAAVIDTTPAWKPVVEALANLRPGGRLVINAIRKEDVDKGYLLRLSYHEHLWMEKEIKSVTNITRKDILEFLPIAAELRIKPRVTTYPLEQANQALIELRRGRIKGAAVLTIE